VVAREATSADHAPEFFGAGQLLSRFCKRSSQSVVLVSRINKKVGSIEGVTCGVMVGKCSLCGENVPRVVDVKMSQPDHQGEVSSSHRSCGLMNGNELTLGKEAVMLGQFCDRIGALGRVHFCTDR